MIGQFVHGRVYVFIDAANIWYSQQTLRWRVDYEKLKEYLQTECNLQGLYFYTGILSDKPKEQIFIDKLRNIGYHVKIKIVKQIKITKHKHRLKGNLDIELVIDALKYINAYDYCILMSGDSDFAPLIDELKEKGKGVIVMSTKYHISRELIERSKYINLKRLKNQISYKKIPLKIEGEV